MIKWAIVFLAVLGIILLLGKVEREESYHTGGDHFTDEDIEQLQTMMDDEKDSM